MISLSDLENIPSWEWPESAGSLIRSGLVSENTSEKLTALRLAGDLVVMNDEMAELLLAVLESDEAPELRVCAALALGPALEHADTIGFDDSLDLNFDDRALGQEQFLAARRILKGAYENTASPAALRRASLEALVRAPEAWHEAAVRDAEQTNDRQWQITAIFCMGYLPNFSGRLLEILNSSDPDFLMQAVLSTGQLGLDAAAGRLCELARSNEPDRDVRLAAIDALANLDAVEVKTTLLELLESDDQEIRDAAQEAHQEFEALNPVFDSER